MVATAQLVLTDPVPDACKPAVWQRLFQAWTLRKDAPRGDVIVSFVGTTQMEELYEQAFGERKATDVLSIPYTPNGLIDARVEMPAGEIIICIPVARKQAIQVKATLEVELATLFVHGLLHITGRDHDTSRKKDNFHQDTRDIMKTEKLTPVDLWSV